MQITAICPFQPFVQRLVQLPFWPNSHVVAGVFCVCYALSGLAGAFRLTPFSRYHCVTFYLEDKVNELVKRMDLKPVTSGENVTIVTPLDDGVFYDLRHIGEMWVASPIQLYLDLNVLGDRGKEAADYIFKGVIEPQWEKKK